MTIIGLYDFVLNKEITAKICDRGKNTFLDLTVFSYS